MPLIVPHAKSVRMFATVFNDADPHQNRIRVTNEKIDEPPKHDVQKKSRCMRLTDL
jgi:hypothetical protein